MNNLPYTLLTPTPIIDAKIAEIEYHCNDTNNFQKQKFTGNNMYEGQKKTLSLYSYNDPILLKEIILFLISWNIFIQ